MSLKYGVSHNWIVRTPNYSHFIRGARSQFNMLLIKGLLEKSRQTSQLLIKSSLNVNPINYISLSSSFINYNLKASLYKKETVLLLSGLLSDSYFLEYLFLQLKEYEKDFFKLDCRETLKEKPSSKNYGDIFRYNSTPIPLQIAREILRVRKTGCQDPSSNNTKIPLLFSKIDQPSDLTVSIKYISKISSFMLCGGLI